LLWFGARGRRRSAPDEQPELEAKNQGRTPLAIGRDECGWNPQQPCVVKYLA
jgi:hypothetical protein